MPFDSVLREDILTEDLTKEQKNIKVISETQFKIIVNKAVKPPTVSPEPAKNIIEVMDLIDQAFKDYEKRAHTEPDGQIKVLYDSPDRDAQLEAVSISVNKREPGMFGKGAPFENRTKQLRPLLREVVDDEEHPGYKRAVLGYWYDNVLRLTAWARTNKAANDRALWVESVMEEYSWFFGYMGVQRLIYQGRAAELKKEINQNKIYGRPIDYFVRTEKLRSVSQKELEEVCVRLALAKK